MKSVIAFIASTFATFICSQETFAQTCRVIGCENCAIELDEFDENLGVTFTGNELFTRIARPTGSTLTYSGPANGGFLSFGPYYNQPGSRVAVEPSIVISTNWRPDTYDTCRKRNWRSKCVGWDTHNHETGFTIDYMINRVVIYSEVKKNKNRLNHARFKLPTILCDGPLKELEIRVHGAYGGSMDFTIQELRLDTRWDR